MKVLAMIVLALSFSHSAFAFSIEGKIWSVDCGSLTQPAKAYQKDLCVNVFSGASIDPTTLLISRDLGFKAPLGTNLSVTIEDNTIVSYSALK